MNKRRGKRVVVGYVVSHTGKRGGPWEANRAVVWGVGTYDITFARRWSNKGRADAEEAAAFVRRFSNTKPDARALPLVRYELDEEEERLRDAVVASAISWESTRSEAWSDDLAINIRALRAHREEVRR